MLIFIYCSLFYAIYIFLISFCFLLHLSYLSVFHIEKARAGEEPGVRVVRGRDERLDPLQRFQKILFARPVKLGKHVVQQQHGRMPGTFPQDIEARRFDGEHQRAQLPLRREHPNVLSIEAYLKVVPVRSGGAAALGKLPLPAAGGIRKAAKRPRILAPSPRLQGK